MTQDAAQHSYNIFRGGHCDGKAPPPHWDDLDSWVREAILFAYTQGTLEQSKAGTPLAEAEIERLRKIEAAATELRRSFEDDGWDAEAIERGICRPGMRELMLLIPSAPGEHKLQPKK